MWRNLEDTIEKRVDHRKGHIKYVGGFANKHNKPNINPKSHGLGF